VVVGEGFTDGQPTMSASGKRYIPSAKFYEDLCGASSTELRHLANSFNTVATFTLAIKRDFAVLYGNETDVSGVWRMWGWDRGMTPDGVCGRRVRCVELPKGGAVKEGKAIYVMGPTTHRWFCPIVSNGVEEGESLPGPIITKMRIH
jgi:hypothetical protein